MEATSLNAAFNRLHEKLGDRCRRFTPHDLRSTARSHLGALGVEVLIAERCLNHSLGGLVAVYDKHDYLPERRNALELWSAKVAAWRGARGSMLFRSSERRTNEEGGAAVPVERATDGRSRY